MKHGGSPIREKNTKLLWLKQKINGKAHASKFHHQNVPNQLEKQESRPRFPITKFSTIC
jgi:hypothetical protein